MNQVPHWLKSYLKPQDIDEIVADIARAEDFTSGEIVPMIVRSSSTFGHVGMSLFCIITIIFFLSSGHELQKEFLGESPLWLLLDFAIFFAVAHLLSQVASINRILVPKKDQEYQVVNRAKLAFYEEGLQQTQGSTGILIFLSLWERRVVVLADKAIAERLPEDTWNRLVAMIVSGVKNKDLKGGLSSAIKECGSILKPSFPKKNDDKNELHNRLIISE